MISLHERPARLERVSGPSNVYPRYLPLSLSSFSGSFGSSDSSEDRSSPSVTSLSGSS